MPAACSMLCIYVWHVLAFRENQKRTLSSLLQVGAYTANGWKRMWHEHFKSKNFTLVNIQTLSLSIYSYILFACFLLEKCSFSSQLLWSLYNVWWCHTQSISPYYGEFSCSFYTFCNSFIHSFILLYTAYSASEKANECLSRWHAGENMCKFIFSIWKKSGIYKGLKSTKCLINFLILFGLTLKFFQ